MGKCRGIEPGLIEVGNLLLYKDNPAELRMLWHRRKRMVHEIEAKAEGQRLLCDLFDALSIVKIQGKHLATLKESLYTPGPFPLRALVKHERAPGLPS